MSANEYLTTNRIPGGIVIGPVVDDKLVPDLPGKLLLEGRYHKGLEGIISANNAHEVSKEKDTSCLSSYYPFGFSSWLHFEVVEL